MPDEFLGETHARLDLGDINETTFREYERTCEAIDAYFGKYLPVETPDGSLNDVVWIQFRARLGTGSVRVVHNETRLLAAGLHLLQAILQLLDLLG